MAAPRPRRFIVSVFVPLSRSVRGPPGGALSASAGVDLDHTGMKIAAAAIPLISALCLPVVHGHGAVVHPPPRQAADRDLMPWSGVMPKVFPDVESKTGLCPVPGSADGKPSGQNGQACFCKCGCDS